MSVGDLIDGYTTDTAQLRREWEEFDGFVEQLDMPFFYLPGNHDITNEVMERVWQDRLGPTHYFFVYRDVLFLCLNSEDQRRGSRRGSISDAQYDWIKRVLAEHTDVRWTMVFMHQPLWVQEVDPVRWFDVEKLLADRPHSVFAGHRHHYVKYERNQNNYYMLATTGGGSRLRGPQFGEFDHVVWVTMTKAGPIIANLQLEGIWDENMVTEEIDAYIQQLSQVQPFQVEPLYYEEESFSSGRVKVRITNDAEYPLQVNLRNKFSWTYTAGFDREQITLAPNSVEFVYLDMNARKNTGRDTQDPVQIQADIRYLETENPAGIAIPHSFWVGPEKKRRVNRISKPISIDGNLEEWESLPYEITHGAEAPDDVSGYFQVQMDEKWLYLAVRVKDDQVVADTSLKNNQDLVGFVLNVDPLAESAMDMGEGQYEHSTLFLQSPKNDQMPGTTVVRNKLPKKSPWICKTVEGGYVLEGAFPLSYLKEKQGNDWESFRLNVFVQDRDTEDDSVQQYFWLPDWAGGENRIGSGMFFKK
jgi:hypothetical protein